MSSEHLDLRARVEDLERAVAERDATIDRLQRVRAALIARALRSSSRTDGGYGLLESQTLLSQQVRSRTHQLEALSEKLLAAKEEAEAAMLARTTFLAAMSHEIRTPLNGIIGYTELIQQAGDLETVRAHAGIVLHESELLLALITDILDYAKIDAGRIELESVPLLPRSIVDSVVAAARHKATRKGLRLETAIAADVPEWILGDPVRLRQILLNLVDNAVKFTPEGRVEIRVVVDVARPGRLLFEVEDTGIGIPADKHALIFEPFTQADGTTTRRYGGSGLGTSIARQLAALMGGDIGLRSQPNEGSVFWYSIPAPAVAAADVPAHVLNEWQGSTSRVTQPPPTGAGRRVLVVDDHPTNRDLFSSHLRSAGYEVVWAADGIAALDACDGARFDLILMDVQMPEIDGYETSRRLRAHEDWRRYVPILALTAHVRHEYRDACYEAGMNEVLHKPVRRASLLDTVAKVLGLNDQPATIHLPCAAGTHAPSSPEEDAIDLAVAIEELGGPEQLKRVVVGFLSTLDEQIVALTDAIERGDADVVRREAHRMKGGAGMLEALPLMRMAQRLEKAAAGGDLHGARELLAGIQCEGRRVREHVSRYFALTLEIPHV